MPRTKFFLGGVDYNMIWHDKYLMYYQWNYYEIYQKHSVVLKLAQSAIRNKDLN